MLSILILLLIILLFVQMLDRRGVFVRFVILIRGILVLVFEFIVRDTDAPGRIEHPEHGDNLLCQCLALGADKMEFFGEVVEIEVRHFSLVTVIGIVYRDRNVIFRTAQQLHQMSVTDKLRVIALAGRHLVYQLLDKLVGLFPFLFLCHYHIGFKFCFFIFPVLGSCTAVPGFCGCRDTVIGRSYMHGLS